MEWVTILKLNSFPYGAFGGFPEKRGILEIHIVWDSKVVIDWVSSN